MPMPKYLWWNTNDRNSYNKLPNNILPNDELPKQNEPLTLFIYSYDDIPNNDLPNDELPKQNYLMKNSPNENNPWRSSSNPIMVSLTKTSLMTNSLNKTTYWRNP